MNFALSPATRRFAAVGLLFVAIALFWAVVVAPLLDARTQALATIARLEPVIEHGRRAAGDVAALRKQLQRLKQQHLTASGLLTGTNEPIAAAQLQDSLKRAIDGVGGTLASTQVLPARDDGGRFRRITIRARLSVDLPALQRLTYELESSVPYLFLDNVDIARRSADHLVQPPGSPVRPARQAGNEATSRAAGGDPPLDVSFDLYGYVRRPT